MNEQSKHFLYSYLNSDSPTGYEVEGQKIWLEYVKPYTDTYFTDTYGSAVAVINPDAPYKVVIEAHCDEISWFVNYISKEGYIHVIRNGGSDYVIAPSKKAKIHGENGMIPAVFGWPAIHVREKREEGGKMDVETVVLDCGAGSDEEAKKMGVEIGSVVTFDDQLIELNGRYIAGRALDNRIGGFMIAEVARLIKENNIKLPFGLYVTNAVQEEIGLRGAEMIAHRIKPHLAIITDVCHDTTAPGYNKIKQGDQRTGKGPVLSFAPAVHNNVLKMLFEVAKNKEIPYQRSALSRASGTDTDAFAYSNEGVASALISLPLKYMHTTVEMADLTDIENVIRLMYEFVVQLQSGHDFRYIK
ncbi:MAG: M42 family metallopeptidase [Cyclobacteriaceae bacterium]|nr:M42 family metallopeptidase [Cyclobacteriaceae bacterium]